MPIRIREVDNISILDIDGRIDINSSEIIEMIGWLVNSGKVNIIINLENVDLVDYNGLSILAIAYKNVTNHKGRLKLLHVPLSVQELFNIVKFDSVFEVHTDESLAVESFFNQEISHLRLRRRFQRFDIHLKVKYRLVAAQKGAKVFEGEVLNVSAAGLYIYSQYAFPANSLLELELNLPNAAKAIETTGKVVWLADREIQPHAYPGMGVAFSHLESASEKTIVDFVDKNISHRAEPL